MSEAETLFQTSILFLIPSRVDTEAYRSEFFNLNKFLRVIAIRCALISSDYNFAWIAINLRVYHVITPIFMRQGSVYLDLK